MIFWISFIIYLNIIQNIIHNIIQNSADMSASVIYKTFNQIRKCLWTHKSVTGFLINLSNKQNDRWGPGVIDSSAN